MKETKRWRPNTSINTLLHRSSIITDIRKFFAKKKILEVETPTMSQATVTDVHISSFKTNYIGPSFPYGKQLYLTTSPEYHMKRLLAAGSGPIFQICRSFRNGEKGRYHNPEFTILEWYRLNFKLNELMNEVNELLQQILNCKQAEFISYQEIFLRHFNLNPLERDLNQLIYILNHKKILKNFDNIEDYDSILELLLSIIIERDINNRPLFIYHFPASQASLAEINEKDQRIAERFEVYFQGIELANGFIELTDSIEQRYRLEQNNHIRSKKGFEEMPIDNNFLLALKHGLPYCAGVAVGIDRLIMRAVHASKLSDIIPFTMDNC
ncbi:MAG: elongation factor P--(R)-beta-lysine ligase [Candidatus Dasytiphilus stammeri]